MARRDCLLWEGNGDGDGDDEPEQASNRSNRTSPGRLSSRANRGRCRAELPRCRIAICRETTRYHSVGSV